MNLSRIIAVVLAIACVGLGAATLNLSQQNRELNTQLSAVDAARQAVDSFPMSESRSGLRQALESEQVANAELRQELARWKGVPVASNTAPAVTTTTEAQPARGGTEGWLDRIKQQDPERYKQVVAERDQRRKDLQDWQAETLAQLAARAQSPSMPEEAALVTQISDTLTKLNDLRQQMAASRQLPDDQRQAQMAQLIPEMQSTWQQLTALRDQDRALQYLLLGKQLGLSPDRAQSLATTIPTILQNTQYTPTRGGGPGWGGGQWSGGGR